MNTVRMSVQGPHSAVEFRSLYRWLRHEGGELRAAGIRMGDPGSLPGPGEMGGTLEVVQFAFEAVAQYGALAVAIASWRKAHEPRSALVFERNGLKVSLDEAQLLEDESVRRVLQELMAAQVREDERGEDSRDGEVDQSEPGDDGESTGDAA